MVLMTQIMAQAHPGLRLCLTTTRTQIPSPALQMVEMKTVAWPPISGTEAQRTLTVVAQAFTPTTGVWTLGPDIVTREGEEGVATGADNLTGVEEAAGMEQHNIPNDISPSHSGVHPTSTPVLHLRAISPLHMVNNRATEMVGNGLTAGHW